MDKIIKVFKYSGFTLILIASISFIYHFVYAINAYNDGVLSVKVVQKDPQPDVKVINGIRFTNSEVGLIEVKPTFLQAAVLCDKEVKDNGAKVIFCFIVGVVILTIAYKRPDLIEDLTERRLWQFVGAGVILFFGVMFLVWFLANAYVQDLTHGHFKVYRPYSEGDSLGTLLLILVTNIIYNLFSYSKKLQEENDLTI